MYVQKPLNHLPTSLWSAEHFPACIRTAGKFSCIITPGKGIGYEDLRLLMNHLQVIHYQSQDHCIVASTISCEDGEVKVYDSAFSSLDKETHQVICFVVLLLRKMIETQKQKGCDCLP